MRRLLAAGLVLGLCAFGVSREGVEFPETLRVDGQEVRFFRGAMKRMFGLKIYYGALYLKKAPGSVKEVIEGDDPLVLRMHYGYMPVPHGLLVDGIEKHFTKALGKDRAGLKPEFARYVAGYDRALAIGDVVEVVYRPRFGVSLVLSGKTNVTVPGLPFKKALLSTWFGDNAPDPSLRGDLLGL
ncbi:MAG: chalcone isomerase family protein [Spirochaetes bacterium]|nr:chalcone isomerase family protein [Spirochaetota bacterium]